jgi:hypothetical protein
MEYEASRSAWDVISAEETCDDCYDEGMAFSLLFGHGANGGWLHFTFAISHFVYAAHMYSASVFFYVYGLDYCPISSLRWRK